MRTEIIRPRGIMAVRANGDVNSMMARLSTGFEEFKASYSKKYDGLAAEIAALNQDRAAQRIGGIGKGEPSSAALASLGDFARTGKPEALHGGRIPQAAMSTDSGPDGGYLVPEELSTEIARLQRNDSVMRRLARVISTSSATFKQPKSLGGMGSGWVGEREARPETDGLGLEMIEIVGHEIYANPAVTAKLLDDAAYDLGAFIASEIADEFTAQEGAAFISGDGVNKPRGFLNYSTATTADSTRPSGTLQYFPSGAASDFVTPTTSVSPADALVNLVYGLKTKYRQNGVWIMNSNTAGKVRKFKDADGAFIWQNSLILGQPPLLLGYPVELDEDMPDVGAGAFPVAFGDFKRAYMIADRVGTRVLRDPYSNKPFIHFYTTKRVGGALVDSNAVKLLKIATS